MPHWHGDDKLIAADGLVFVSVPLQFTVKVAVFNIA
jgi:hypothetical protein